MPEDVVCRADWRAGRATFTTVPSMKTMLEPRMAAARIHVPRGNPSPGTIPRPRPPLPAPGPTPSSALRACWWRIPPSCARPFSRHDRRWSSPRGGFMLFMGIERFRPGRAPDIYRRFRDKGRLAPGGLRYVSSWVDLGFTRCFQVMEADSEALLAEWT